MKQALILIGAMCLMHGNLWSQQDAHVSMYLRNPIQFNSAHAGLDGTLRATAITRMQWTGWDGAPRTQLFSVHSPLLRSRMGGGLTVLNDESGARNQREIMLHGAYHIPKIGSNIHGSIGLGFGLHSEGYDFQDLFTSDPGDALMMAPYAATRFNASFGILVHAEAWFAGYSLPQLMEHDLGDVAPMGRVLKHHYVTAGYIRPLNASIDIRVVGLFRAVADAPNSMDLNVECWFYDVISAGAMCRFNEGMGWQASYRFKEGWRFHYAVDFPLNGLMSRSFGSHEIGIAWDYGQVPIAFKSPRYF
jgi:type IX secretion system PorP/SprF family membrane protein